MHRRLKNNIIIRMFNSYKKDDLNRNVEGKKDIANGKTVKISVTTKIHTVTCWQEEVNKIDRSTEEMGDGRFATIADHIL